jgi:hypothetical protein
VSTSDAPAISGQPVSALNVGATYKFQPTASVAGGAALTFAIQNMPSWATFSTSTGELTGVPSVSDIGTYNGIVISASDGTATSSLPAFNIAVTQMSNGSVTISWVAPTANTNGTPLTNLAGYKIYYGTSLGSLNKSVNVTNASLSSYVIENLSPATWYFSVVSYNSADVESPESQIVSMTIA